MVFAAIIVRVHRVLEQRDTECSLEEVVQLCPELTWNQVFLAVDYLSRNGQVRVTRDGDGIYRVEASPAVPIVARSETAARHDESHSKKLGNP